MLNMDDNGRINWPSGDCVPILATQKVPRDLVGGLGLRVFRDRDDLDWFEAAIGEVESIGPILIMRHENNPKGLTAIYVDSFKASPHTEQTIITFLALRDSDVAWRRSQAVE